MRCRAAGVLLAVVLLVAGQGRVAADEIVTTDGSRLIGEVLALEEGSLRLRTTFAGEIVVSWENVESIETDKPLPVVFGDGNRLNALLLQDGNGKVTLATPDGTFTGTLDVNHVSAINPSPPPVKPPVKWTGSVTGSFSESSGNTERTSASLRAALARRTDKDRIRLDAGWEYGKDYDELSRRNSVLAAKYDYFFTKKGFTYLNTKLENDEFQNLRLRTSVGAGLGYQFIENERRNFFAEAGLSYVNEDFDDSDDQGFLAGRLASHFDWWIVSEKIRFLQDTELLVSFDDIEDWLITTQTDLRWKLNSRWYTNAGVRFKYDNVPDLGAEEEDILYTLGFGYEF